MIDTRQLVHEIAIAYAQSHYMEQIERKSRNPSMASAMNRSFLDLYIAGTEEAVKHLDKINAAYHSVEP